MDDITRNELVSIISEIETVLKELGNIASGVQTDFSGIGNERCASAIKNVISQYEWIKKQLYIVI